MRPLIQPFHIPLSRRKLLHSLLLTTGGIITSQIHAEALTLTPRMTEGPYYPDHLPLNQDNDLVRLGDGDTSAAGIVTQFGGRLLSADGKPVKDATIELWQADNNGCYIHTRGVQRGKERDEKFQGYGKVVTNSQGEYRFRTIKPGLYTGRTRHYHVAVMQNGKRMLTTQLFLAGEPGNDRDGVLSRIGDAAQRLSVIREFKAREPGGSELFATWDIAIGTTPEDRERGGPGGRPPGPEAGKGGRPGNAQTSTEPREPARQDGNASTASRRDREARPEDLFGPRLPF